MATTETKWEAYNSYGIAIFPYNIDRKFHIEIETGDVVAIEERAPGWFKGFIYRKGMNADSVVKKGVFPSSYILLWPENDVPLEPLAREEKHDDDNVKSDDNSKIDDNNNDHNNNNDNNNNDDNIEQPIYHTDNKDNEKDKNVNGNMDPVSVGREQRLERLHQLQQRRQELQDLLTSRQHQVESKGEGNDDARQHTAMLKNMLGVLGGNGDSESEEDFSNQDRTDQESNENLIGDHDKDNDEIVENEDTNKNGERRLDKFVLDGKTLHLPHVRETDSLCYRIESLRMYLEQALGEDRMLRVYRLVEEGADSDDPRLQADLPPALVGYLSLVHQLLFCETVFNERQEENL
eukprot:gb/GECH01012899.1/.p1 GENE.gb/GECH01012899.1/~~gb/GECH01012899.1/.p1  ORF type:complete len:349 (+),score=98.60 gb/GECH01012899.1/:1-1047(+)